MVENPSEKSDSSEILGSWDSLLNDDDAVEKEKIPEDCDDAVEKEKASTDKGKCEGEASWMRTLPATMQPSYEWGGGKWKEDGRKNRNKYKKTDKAKEKESDEKMEEAKEGDDVIPFKEIIEALLRNSGQETGSSQTQMSCVEMLKKQGLRFP